MGALHRRRTVRLSLLLLLAVARMARADAGDAGAGEMDGWKLYESRRGLELYERTVEGSDLVAFMGRGTIDAPIVKVASALLDGRRATEWVDSLAEVKRAESTKPGEYVEYVHVETPFVIKDRDFVNLVKIEVFPERGELTVTTRATTHPDFPETGYVRGQVNFSRFKLKSIDGGKRTSTVAEMHVDPRGSVARWIVNLFQRAWPRKAFEGIRRQVTKPDIAPPPELKGLLQPLADGA